MKKVLLILLMFPIFAIFLVSVFSAAYLMIQWGLGYNPELLPVASVWTLIPLAIKTVFLTAVVCVLFLLLSTLQRGRTNPLPAAALLAILGFGAIFFGQTILSRFDAEIPDTRNPFISGYIHNFPGSSVYVEQVGPEELRTLSVFSREQSPHLKIYRTGRLNIGSRTLVLDDRTIPLTSANPFFNRLFSSGAILSGLAHDIQLLNRFAGKLQTEGWIFLVLLAAGISLFSVSCLAIIRISRWPLFNTFAALLLFRLFFFLFRLPDAVFMQDLVKILGEPMVSSLLPPVILIFIAVIFTILQLVTGKDTPE